MTPTEILHNARNQCEVGTYAFTVLVHAESYVENNSRILESARVRYAKKQALGKCCKVCGRGITVGHSQAAEPLCLQCLAWASVLPARIWMRQMISDTSR